MAEAASASGGLAAVPALVLEAVWSRMSFVARRNLRATCRTLRRRIDDELIRSVVVMEEAAGSSGATNSIGIGIGIGGRCAGAVKPPNVPHPQLPPEVRRMLLSVSRSVDARPSRVASTPAASETASTGAPAVPNRCPQANPTAPGDTGAVAAPPAPPPATAAPGRFRSLRALVLMPQAPPTSTPAALGGSSPYAASLQPFLSRPPALPPARFAACAASLSHLVLLDPSPAPSERDIAAVAAAFPGLVSLQLLATPGRAARVAVPPLGALRACPRLRSLGLDLGRSSVLGAGCRASLGLLTQLSRLVLGLADTGGDEAELAAAAAAPPPPLSRVGCACGCSSCPNHHHHHHLHRCACASVQAESGCRTQPQAGGGGAGGPSYVVAAMVGGVEASLYTLGRANLRSLELRVISFGSYHRRLLQAVAAGGADAGAGLEHLCLRLMPSATHAAATSASFAAGGSAGLGGAFGGGGLGGELGTPCASLSFGPLPLGDAPGVPAAAVGWAQPSETELMMAALPAFPGLERLEVPELLLTASNQLTCLRPLTRLRELRVGGVVAAGVSARSPPVGRLPELRALVVEAESPVYGGTGVVPWWSWACPSLQQLSLTLQYGDGGRQAGWVGVLGGGWHDGRPAAEQLAAALARVPEVRLVVCVAGRGAAGSAVTHMGDYGYGVTRGWVQRGDGGGGGFGANGAGEGLAPLRKDLGTIVRHSGTVRHLDLYAADVVDLLSCLSDDLLLVTEQPPPSPMYGIRAREGGGGAAAAGMVRDEEDGSCDPAPRHPVLGVETLRLVAGASSGLPDARAIPLLCSAVTKLLDRACPALPCLCLSVPGLWAVAGDGGVSSANEDTRWWARAGREGDRDAALGTVMALARSAEGRGTRLCLCGLGGGERSALLHRLERGGVSVAEGCCRGSELEGPVHAAV